MKNEIETINVRLVAGDNSWLSWLRSLAYILVMLLFLIVGLPFGLNLTEKYRQEPKPYTLDFRDEDKALSVDTTSRWELIVTVPRKDGVETRFYDRDTGKLLGTVLTRTEKGTEDAPGGE